MENRITAFNERVRISYERLVADAAVQKGLDFITRDHDRTVAEQIEITEIPAPPFQEKERAEAIKHKLEELGLEDTKMDAEGNVYGLRRGTGNGPKIFVSAHLDTVFPEETDTRVKEKEGVLYAPGIGDDTRGLAELLAVVRAFNEAEIRNTGDILFGGTVGEEGAGDLRGVKAFFKEQQDIDGFISLDGPGWEQIIYLGTGSFRYKVTYKGPGGHSFGAFGTPSATHALGRAIAEIAELQTKKEPKTTFSVGEVQGGTSVNAIAEEASMTVDLRSNELKELEQLEQRFLAIVEKAAADENRRWGDDRMTVITERFGNRPAAVQLREHEIIQAAAGAVEAAGGYPVFADPSSTDANFPMSIGIPSVTLGLGGQFGGAHTLNEWFNPENSYLSVRKNFLVILGLAGVEGISEPLLEKGVTK